VAILTIACIFVENVFLRHRKPQHWLYSRVFSIFLDELRVSAIE